MLKPLRCLCLDIDGILTDGSKLYDKTGLCIGKSFRDQNWTALKRFRAAGIIVLALTGDPWNEEICHNRRIPVAITRGHDKLEFLPIICKDHNVSPEEIAYIGDDLFDIKLLEKIGYPFAPSDATSECASVSRVLKSKGGENILMELFYHCRGLGIIPTLPFDEEMQKIKELDKHEHF